MLNDLVPDAIVRRMTLRQILKNHGIRNLREFQDRLRGAFSRQHAWNLWNGYTGVGKGTARRLEELLGIPYDELMHVRPIPATKRYRKQPRPPEQPPEED
jgi:transcriptional regulator with XRE-family HTH domain